ncbi:MAG TPA: sulfurtransferase TusA family protein [Anaerolineaceae bacterium]|jgi:TusA-related sulfurtransferase|nr:SirA family protein [Chloroflexota bacterium]HNZ01796.1 sulfurtransferase TusA family protein [Anaerolineaceae bacterium]HOH21542.1 sulfurtransferase TusA family protein [Anaerolineaceae bacterium]HOU44795.1 sulfurtransferase TusA family protein [Anaerolineaceae bacterium]HPA34627.1 sulfurtransferase TusA family protein [Anaerolineaceae bacterium]
MNKLVDARGLSCPQPVMLAQKAIEEGVFPIEVLVDTVTSRENVRRMAEFRKCKVEITQDGDEFRLVLSK